MELLGQPFTRTRALATGSSPRILRRSGVRRIAPRAYLAQAEPRLVDRVNGHLLTLPGDVLVEGVTALQLYGLDLGPHVPLRFCSPAGRDIRRRDVRVRRVRTAPPHRRRVVTPVGALLTAAAELHLVDLVAAGDWLVRHELISLVELRGALAGARGPYSRKLHRVAELVRERVDSVQESRLRMLVVLAGLPEPDCNIRIGNEHFFIAQVDLLFALWKLVLEYEGDQHRTEKKQWNRDIDRFEWLAEEKYAVIRVTAARMQRARSLVHSIHTALVRAGFVGPAPDFSADWLSYFEGGN